jgi:F-type H+-transporting ATPase subunit beta
MEQLSVKDRNVVNRARKLERFLTQPFFATEQFSGIKGQQVSLDDALNGCERILADEFKDYPESAFYMIGSIDEVKKPEGRDEGENKNPETDEETKKQSKTKEKVTGKEPEITA